VAVRQFCGDVDPEPVAAGLPLVRWASNRANEMLDALPTSEGRLRLALARAEADGSN
jgi:hypothetical protein